MGKISNLKKEHLLHEENLLHIYIKSLIVSGYDRKVNLEEGLIATCKTAFKHISKKKKTKYS